MEVVDTAVFFPGTAVIVRVIDLYDASKLAAGASRGAFISRNWPQLLNDKTVSDKVKSLRVLVSVYRVKRADEFTLFRKCIPNIN